jgi:hypothetical protein
MSRLRAAVTWLEALAVAMALSAPCPCDASTPKAAADAHACCHQTGPAVAASDGCCNHCGLATRPASAEPAFGRTTLLGAPAVDDAVVASGPPTDTGHVQPAVLAPSPPSLSAPRPLRI